MEVYLNLILTNKNMSTKMNMRIIVFIIFLFGLNLSLLAQEDVEDVTVNVPMNKWKETDNKLNLFSDSILYLNSELDKMKKNEEELLSSLQKSNESISNLQMQIQQMKTDSINAAKTIAGKESEILGLKNQLGRVDTMAVQMIITYMNLRCSENRINILREEFSKISNPKIKNDYKKWDDLLAVYSQTYYTVKETIQTYSNQISGNPMPSLRDRYLDEANQKLSKLPYIKQLYNQKECTSPYLNNMIKQAFSLLTPQSKQSDYLAFFETYK